MSAPTCGASSLSRLSAFRLAGPERAEQREFVDRQTAREQRTVLSERLEPAFGGQRNASRFDPRLGIGLPSVRSILAVVSPGLAVPALSMRPARRSGRNPSIRPGDYPGPSAPGVKLSIPGEPSGRMFIRMAMENGRLRPKYMSICALVP